MFRQTGMPSTLFPFSTSSVVSIIKPRTSYVLRVLIRMELGVQTQTRPKLRFGSIRGMDGYVYQHYEPPDTSGSDQVVHLNINAVALG
jgi:hypothetical protein